MATYLETHQKLQAGFDDPSVRAERIDPRDMYKLITPRLREIFLGHKLEARTALVAPSRHGSLAIAALTKVSKYHPDSPEGSSLPADYLHMYEQFDWADVTGKHTTFMHTHLHVADRNNPSKGWDEFYRLPMPGDPPNERLWTTAHMSIDPPQDIATFYHQNIVTLVSAAQSNPAYAWLRSLRPPTGEVSSTDNRATANRTPDQFATQAAWLIRQCRQ
jgi:hypothetical protein